MAVTEKISKLVQNQFPSFYKEEGENFLAFVEAYYAWMEENGNLTDGIRNLESYRDISTTTDDYIKYFMNTFLPSVPVDMVADKKMFIKLAKTANQSRGTIASYKLLFRAIYGEDIDVKLPADNILKVSDGDWRIDRYLVGRYEPSTYNFIGKTIVGADSGASALVEDVVRRTIRGVEIMQILVSNVVGRFYDLEPIKLKTDTLGTGHTPIINAGIDSISITAAGGGYNVGDIVTVTSDEIGDFARVAVTETVDLNGTLTFSLNNGGSGYRASTVSPGSTITLSGGDGTGASFSIEESDLYNSVTMYVAFNKISDVTEFGSTYAPSIVNADGISRQMETFANTILSSVMYGFPDTTDEGAGKKFHDNIGAVLVIANSTVAIANGSDLFGETSGANGTVVEVISGSAGNAVLKINGYKNFDSAESVLITTPTGSNVGTVTSFSSNTVGFHVLNIANTQDISVGDELVGVTSGSFAVVKSIAASAASNTYLRVTANTTANLTSQFDSGPLIPFSSGENIRLVDTSTVVGTALADTSNTTIQNIYTPLIDALLFDQVSVGTIQNLTDPIGGTGYTEAPTVSVTDTEIAALDIKEYYVTLQSDDENWGTGNSNFTTLSSADRLYSGSASGYIVASTTPGSPISVSQYSNGTYETSVRVWQDQEQYNVGATYSTGASTFETFAGGYTIGNPEADSRTKTNDGSATIVSVEDKGIIGQNSNISASVGANGAITSFRIWDSGFSYRDTEEVTFGLGSGTGPFAAQGTVRLRGVANSAGYYASTRSHVSSLRAYIQDNRYYHEFSYEVQSPISIDRYRDVVLKLVHPAGQRLFGKYKLESSNPLDIQTYTASKKRAKANGSIAFANGSFTITGTGTEFTNNYANGGSIIVEYAPRSFYTIPLNIVSNNTIANTKIAWANTNLSSANIYYTSSNSSANIYYQVA